MVGANEEGDTEGVGVGDGDGAVVGGDVGTLRSAVVANLDV